MRRRWIAPSSGEFEQLAKIPPAAARAELGEYGAWQEEELGDHRANLHRLLWIAAGDILEQEAELELEDGDSARDLGTYEELEEALEHAEERSSSSS